MMNGTREIFISMLVALLVASPVIGDGSDFSLGTSFTYQGELRQSGKGADGIFDFELELYERAEGGASLGQATLLDQPVSAGTFAVELDFGQSVTGAVRWLEIRVREAGVGAFATLTPRQRLAASSICTVNSDLEVIGDVAVKGTQMRFQSLAGGELGGLAYASTLGERLILRTADTDQVWLDQDGRVGIGTPLPTVPLEVTGGADATPAGGGDLVVGVLSGRNLALDGNEILARDNGAPAGLNLNFDGGNVATGGDLLVGGELTTQGDASVGGVLDVGYELVMAEDVGSNVYVSCPVGKKILGVGCMSFSGQQGWFGPSGGCCGPGDPDEWHCQVWENPSDKWIRMWAVCARVQ